MTETLKQSLEESLKKRRTYYALKAESPLADAEIEEKIKTALLNVPSAFNSQSSRIVLLLGEHHAALWQIVKDVLKKKVPAEAFPKTEAKINNCFAAGYGTILFFEDMPTVEGLQKSFPPYAANFPVWSQQTSAMHQLAVWLLLEEAGFGASLQHYNPVIDDEVRHRWNLPENWLLIAQMPFGLPAAEPDAKDYQPLEERFKVFR
ncbi:MAG: nitroreductase family protein [Planctomycetaceae bacterium]|jgi:predicted oxidoreductase (fatty acid repression mutant protein)|nr:nitroreductase family protein [Planctomycetaceae bacterium]